jgi:hypothetical protein
MHKAKLIRTILESCKSPLGRDGDPDRGVRRSPFAGGGIASGPAPGRDRAKSRLRDPQTGGRVRAAARRSRGRR